jgi:hypothetical protein
LAPSRAPPGKAVASVEPWQFLPADLPEAATAHLVEESREGKSRRFAALAPKIAGAPLRKRRCEDTTLTLTIEKGMELFAEAQLGKERARPSPNPPWSHLRTSPLPTLASLLDGAKFLPSRGCAASRSREIPRAPPTTTPRWRARESPSRQRGKGVEPGFPPAGQLGARPAQSGAPAYPRDKRGLYRGKRGRACYCASYTCDAMSAPIAGHLALEP